VQQHEAQQYKDGDEMNGGKVGDGAQSNSVIGFAKLAILSGTRGNPDNANIKQLKKCGDNIDTNEDH